MLEVSKKLQDKGFFRRLNEITKAEDGVSKDAVYSNRCWANARSKVRLRQEKDDSISHSLSETEVINFFQTQLKESDQPHLNINIVNEIYKEMNATWEWWAVWEYSTRLQKEIKRSSSKVHSRGRKSGKSQNV